jgi:hypothetical protein
VLLKAVFGNENDPTPKGLGFQELNPEFLTETQNCQSPPFRSMNAGLLLLLLLLLLFLSSSAANLLSFCYLNAHVC